MGRKIDLKEFEDFMKEQGFEDLDTFRTAIKLNQLMNKAGIEHFKENQALKARWEKLKKYIIEQLEYDEEEIKVISNLPNRFYITAEEMILNKMQELEESND